MKKIFYLIAIFTILYAQDSSSQTTYLYTQGIFANINYPILINDPADATQFPRDTGFIVTFNMGAMTYTPNAGNDVGTFTNLYIPPSSWPTSVRTVDPGWSGASAVQVYQNIVGIQNHSWSAPTGSKPIKTANYSWIPSSPKNPWNGTFGSNSSVCTGFFASIPKSYLQGSIANYAGADLWFTDSVSGKTIIVSGGFFHTSDLSDLTLDQHDLNAIQVVGPLGNSRYFTTNPGSASIRHTTWLDQPWFGYCVTSSNMASIINTVNIKFGLSIAIQNLQLSQALIGSELSLGTTSNGPNAPIGAFMSSYFREWNVYINTLP